MSEPLQARRAGVDVQVFPVADIGYNPYTTVLATSGAQLKSDPDRAKAIVAAVREGWRAYLDDPKPTDSHMHDLNPSMDDATFAEVAEAQKPCIETSELGGMTAERWTKLIGQLAELGDIPQAIPAQDCFRNL
jgi:NitT/TauT family transport system substrate-binding protein